MTRLVRTRDVVRLIFDEKFLHGRKANGIREFRFFRQGRFVKTRAVDCVQNAIELCDALEIVDVGVVTVERSVVAEKPMAVSHERIFRVLEAATLPKLRRDHVFLLENVIDIWHAVAIGTRKRCGIVGMNSSTTPDTRNIMMLRDHENSIKSGLKTRSKPIRAHLPPFYT